MIRQAKHEDVEQIVKIAKKAIHVMNAEGSDQWNTDYPTRVHFSNDIDHQSLYVKEESGQLMGFIVVDQDIANTYQYVTWSFPDEEAGTFHRLAVDPYIRNKGVAKELIQFAETKCKEEGLKAMKVDTYELNTKTQRLFERLGYNYVGKSKEGSGKPYPFYFYEKLLNVE
ncbi:ribosomal protein S18 acetylase RimI-like enzyme [Geomicrobium halophilum]|uniref:Ribosomal protein S18 acetylase RimI-like enzyme n=1 Tax=Geomicrobium halophilum TaxID=549000 RepID=A0A841PP78_9BACL|nr:GNAT family N-acetyltransferase [Geomicrobium halophilum]MBB6450570.1 ribosomal protein S18 acetylase RimI-like enzyme [Geomicrobium halophilum]